MNTQIRQFRIRIAKRKGESVSMNIVALVGNLTRDAEVRQTKSGTAVTSFGIAVNTRHKNIMSGEWEDYPNFFDVTMFGKYGQAISDRLTCGSKVALNGSLRYSSWEKDGQKRSKVEVVADNVEFLSSVAKAETLFDDDCPF